MKLSLLVKRFIMAILFIGVISSFVGLSYAYFDNLQESTNETLTIGEWRGTCTQEITTAQEFYDFVTSSTSNTTDYVCLMNDIDFTGFNWLYGSAYNTNQFLGTFDGGGFTVSNITMNATDTNVTHLSLFSTLNGATIKNVTIDGYQMGFTTAFFASTALQTSLFASQVTGTGNVIDNVTIKNVDVLGDSILGIGGVVSYITANASLTVSNIKLSNVNVQNTNKYVGGLIGFVEAGSGTITIEDIDLTGTIASDNSASNVGGLIGYVDNVSVNISRAIVEYISSSSIALSNGTIAYTTNRTVGGFIGALNRLSAVSITDAFFTGELYNDYKYVGSVSGNNRTQVTQTNVYYSQVWFVNTYTTPSDKNVIHGTLVNATTMPSTTWWDSFKGNFDNANSLWTQDQTGRLTLIR